MKLIYELADEVIEDLGVVGLADYLLHNYPEFAEALSQELHAQLVLGEITREEE